MKITVTAPGMNPSADTEAQGAASQGDESEEYDLLSQLGTNAFAPEMVLINGDQRDLSQELHDGDAVAFGGPVGGV